MKRYDVHDCRNMCERIDGYYVTYDDAIAFARGAVEIAHENGRKGISLLRVTADEILSQAEREAK